MRSLVTTYTDWFEPSMMRRPVRFVVSEINLKAFWVKPFADISKKPRPSGKNSNFTAT